MNYASHTHLWFIPSHSPLPTPKTKSHSSSSMKQSEAAVLTVADLADLFSEETEEIE